MKFSSLNYASNAWSRIITRYLVSVSNSNLYLSRCIRNSLSVGEGYTLGVLIQTKERYSKLAQTGFLADSQALGPLDGVEENLEAVAILLGAFSCPLWVLGALNMTLGVGH